MASPVATLGSTFLFHVSDSVAVCPTSPRVVAGMVDSFVATHKQALQMKGMTEMAK